MIRLWGPMVALLMLAACASKTEAPAEQRGLSQTEIDQMIRDSVADDPVTRSQRDVSLEAVAKGGGRVQVTLTNKTRTEIVLGPQNFALIHPGSREVKHPLSGSRHLFPLTKVGPKVSASGLLEFEPRVVVRGARIAFRAEGLQPAMAEIVSGR